MALSVLAFAGLIKVPEGEGEKAPQGPEGPVALILDVPGKQAVWDLAKAGVEISAAGLAQAVADFRAGKLGPGKALGEEDDE
ncbi:hypothetical protein GPECTOR_102g69 [Gonium pectorale]|uniref:Uncharacterized protein n=1 Tax=Gonium pectorale TaxID=33097 RepID=A0A150FZR7_GONPE|nr:hypothetical protein GPECTOR_102g69 [Gonium pectorale]|eukprot:KXZ43116.1 hypothetical protein GPECTOR_102g69 [Gonium pectorale]